jgi:hypothetical protein
MARYYTTEFLFANAFVLLFARAMQTGSWIGFGLAALSALLAFASHFTAVFVIGACLAVVGLAWIARVPLANLRKGVITLVGSIGVCVLLLLLKELESAEAASLGSFASQSWDPPLLTLLLGTVLRFEPVLIAAGLGGLAMALRRRDPLVILIGAVAVLGPVGVLALKPFFPVGQRYYFACLFPWILLAAMWVMSVGRRSSAGPLAAVTALAVVVAGVGFNTYLYSRDGAGARARWRDAYAYVREHGQPDDVVFVGAGSFQAMYYLRRASHPLRSLGGPDSVAPGSWVVQRTRGTDTPSTGETFEPRARFEIPSKPWSWVVNVLQLPRS